MNRIYKTGRYKGENEKYIMHVPAHTPKKHDRRNIRTDTVAGINSEKEDEDNRNREGQSDRS